MSVITGKVAFANLTETEKYNGTDTGKYSVVLALDEADAERLANEGVKLKTYKNVAQRKFATKFNDIQIIDNDGEPVAKSSIRYGDVVRVKYNLGKPHPVHGSTPYLQAIRVLEKAEYEDADDEF
jgi:hypothetical protein